MLDLDRDRILAHRRRVGALDERSSPGSTALARAAWAGLQDSVPRAALLSIHARVEATVPTAWEDPTFVQLWGPRFSAYVVAAADRAIFTLGRLPDDAPRRRRATDLADRLEAVLDGGRLEYAEAGRRLGVDPNMLRYAATTGRVLLRWDGARRPVVWTVPAPAMDAFEARVELARRYLHVLGPGTAASFEQWAGIRAPRGRAAFEALAPELIAARSPVGDAWILGSDEPSFRASPGPTATIRLLPSGDAFWLLQGRDRELLVPDAVQRARLWTSRVWPGALLLHGEIAGTWRRADADLSVAPWRPLSGAERATIEDEAATLPLPGLEGRIAVHWAD